MPGFWVILAAILLYGAVHSALATLWVKHRARQQFGASSDRWFRFLYNVIAGLTLVPVFTLPVLFEDQRLYQIPWPLRGLTLLGQGVAVLALLVGIMQTGVWSFLGLRQLFYGPESHTQTLVIGGLYRFVRHPLYSAGLAFIWLMPSMTLNLLALNLGISVYIVIGAVLEERKLQTEFGEAYASYRRRTAMLIPFLRLPRPKSD